MIAASEERFSTSQYHLFLLLLEESISVFYFLTSTLSITPDFVWEAFHF